MTVKIRVVKAEILTLIIERKFVGYTIVSGNKPSSVALHHT